MYAVHVGACAGIDGKTELGDVVFSQSALNYEEGKHTFRDDKWAFIPSSEPIRASDTNLASFVSTSENDQYKYGTFATGCAVREDAQAILGRVKENIAREVLALEMEASAFLYACVHTHVTSLGVIKGVTDKGIGKFEGDGDDHHAALCNAADAVRSWIKRALQSYSPLQRGREPGLVVADGYFEGYILPLMKNRKDLWTKKKTIDGGAEGLKVVLPKNNNVKLFARASGVISEAIQEYGIECVCSGDGHDTRTALFKSQNIVDFPRNLANSLIACADSSDQVKLFKKNIEEKSKEQYNSKVQVLSWEEFEKWASNARQAE